MGDIGDVGGRTAGPDAAWQPAPGEERVRTTRGLKAWNRDGRFMPHLDAAEHTCLAVEAPQRAQIPVQALAHGLQDFWRGFWERRRLCQDLGDGVLYHETLLGPLALGD